MIDMGTRGTVSTDQTDSGMFLGHRIITHASILATGTAVLYFIKDNPFSFRAENATRWDALYYDQDFGGAIHSGIHKDHT